MECNGDCVICWVFMQIGVGFRDDGVDMSHDQTFMAADGSYGAVVI